MILKFSLGIFFSIFLFGEGKFILSINTIIIKKKEIINKSLMNNLLIELRLPGLVFLKLHINLNSFKLRHICVFSIFKNMIIKKNLVLIGMMGSGKSTIGNIIAKKIKFDFIDTDLEIEKIEEKTIKEYLMKKEKNILSLEENISLEKLKLKSKVISLGGGGFLNFAVRREVLKESISFWLNWKNDTLVKRIINNKKRPVIVNLSSKELVKMIKLRSHTYKNANFKIDCDNLEKKEIDNKIIKIYEKK